MKKPNLNPAYGRLLRNEDFKKFLKALELRRQRLFEAGEGDEEVKAIFEKRGMRKMLKILQDEGSCNAIFEDTAK